MSICVTTWREQFPGPERMRRPHFLHGPVRVFLASKKNILRALALGKPAIKWCNLISQNYKRYYSDTQQVDGWLRAVPEPVC